MSEDDSVTIQTRRSAIVKLLLSDDQCCLEGMSVVKIDSATKPPHGNRDRQYSGRRCWWKTATTRATSPLTLYTTE